MLTDELGNLLIFNYSPETKESIGGERLIIRSGINIGSLVNTTVRVKGMPPWDSRTDNGIIVTVYIELLQFKGTDQNV